MPDLDPDKVRRAIESEVGSPDSVTSGEHNYRCPFCAKAGYTEKTSHLHVNYDNHVALCHQCGAGFRSLRGIILALYGRVPRGLGAKVDTGEDLSEQALRILYKEVEAVAGAKPEKMRLPSDFRPLTRKPKERLGRVVLNYLLEDRAIPFDYLVEMGVGYCSSGALRGYAVFPVHVGGKLVMYTSRRVVGTGPKVRHAYGQDSASVVLFNFDAACDCRRLFIGEGPFDAMALHRCLKPTDGGMATLGTRVHDGQIRLVATLPCRDVVIWYDADAMDKATSAAQRLAAVCDKRIFIVRHEGKDPDEVPVARRKELVAEAERYEPGLTEARLVLARRCAS